MLSRLVKPSVVWALSLFDVSFVIAATKLCNLTRAVLIGMFLLAYRKTGIFNHEFFRILSEDCLIQEKLRSIRIPTPVCFACRKSLVGYMQVANFFFFHRYHNLHSDHYILILSFWLRSQSDCQWFLLLHILLILLVGYM